MQTHTLRSAAVLFALGLFQTALGCSSDSTTGGTTSSSTGAATSTSSSTGGNPPASPYVVVHGAWQGAWAWDAVAAGLKAKGASVTVVELPAHGADMTALSGATLDAYTARVESAVDAARAPVVLVGHSMAGMVISQVAEQRPDRIAKLVYVGAYLPKDGDSIFALAQADADSHLAPALVIDMKAGTVDVPEDKLDDAFCADCSKAALESMHAHYRAEPLAPFTATVHVTAGNWGKVAKHYVYTKKDHAVSYSFQKTMTTGVTLDSTVELDTGHSPFLSSPDLVTTTLLGL